MPPTTCAGRTGSPRKIAPKTTASAGTPYWSTVTRVGPSTSTPREMRMLAMPAASVPEYRIAATTAQSIVNGGDTAACQIAAGTSTAQPPATDQPVSWSGVMRRMSRAARLV